MKKKPKPKKPYVETATNAVLAACMSTDEGRKIVADALKYRPCSLWGKMLCQ